MIADCMASSDRYEPVLKVLVSSDLLPFLPQLPSTPFSLHEADILIIIYTIPGPAWHSF